MPTHKRSVRHLSVSQLCELTGKTPRTVSKRLHAGGIKPIEEDGRTTYYDSVAALHAIFALDDAQAARARLDNARAERQELELAARRGELVPADDQARVIVALATVIKSRVRAISSRCAPELADERTAGGCKAIVDREVHAALEDLAAVGDELAREDSKKAKTASKAKK